MTQVIAVGDNCLDLFLTRGQMAFGGNALNVAVQWHRMGLQARYFGAVGEDATGALMRQAVLKAGLADEMEILPGTTAGTLLEEVAGDRRVLLEDLVCGLHYIPDAPRMQALAGASWVHLGTNTAPALVRDLVGQGTRFSLDLSTRHQEQDVTGVPLVLASGQGAPRAEIAALLERGARQVVLTCGAEGAFFHDGSTLHHVAAAPAQVVDTCGAGDSFIATFLAEYRVKGRPAPEALALAAKAAALTCGHQGGFPQDPAAIPAQVLTAYAHVTGGQA